MQVKANCLNRIWAKYLIKGRRYTPFTLNYLFNII